MSLGVCAIAGAPSRVAVVVVERSGPGLHCGVVYHASTGEPRYLHLAWHLDLRDEPSLPTGWWVVPSLDDDVLEDAATQAEAVAKSYRDGRVPYAFDRADASILADGRLHLGRSHGLTCASFIALLFESSRASLVEMGSWGQDTSAAREEADRAAQQRIVEWLREGYPEQAALLDAEIGCARLRPEEIAAASGLLPHPLTRALAEAGAQQLWQAITLGP